MTTRFAVSACMLLVLAGADAAAAQIPFATPGSGLAFEAGGFAYGRNRYDRDTEIRFTASVGWRGMRSSVFVEPHVRVMTGLDGWGGDDRLCADVDCVGGSAAQDLPLLWPGIILGASWGDVSFSHALGVRGALGVGDRVQPLLGLRYEASARRAAWYVEASIDRSPWGESSYDPDLAAWVRSEADSRWLAGVSAGGRFWLRTVQVPPPYRPPDAGIIAPEPTPRKP